jgi:hypothetical protein
MLKRKQIRNMLWVYLDIDLQLSVDTRIYVRRFLMKKITPNCVIILCKFIESDYE